MENLRFDTLAVLLGHGNTMVKDNSRNESIINDSSRSYDTTSNHTNTVGINNCSNCTININIDCSITNIYLNDEF